MAGISRASLFRKLNRIGYQAADGATTFCKARGNPHVELVHWLALMWQQGDSDLQRIARHFGLEDARLARDFTAALDALPRGASSVSNFSTHLLDAIERAWVWSTLSFGVSQIRTGHLLVAMLDSENLRHILLRISPEFQKVKLDDLVEGYSKITSGSPEAALSAQDGTRLGDESVGASGGGELPPPGGKQEALARFSVDLTERARKGEIDPVVGRDEEVRQIVDILLRRRQNNPILTGEAGVGKTAVVEGFARRIAAGDVPPSLKDVVLRSLDIGLLQAGASMKGEFENRLRQVIEEVQSSPKPIILFIDEAHTLIGAGGAAGTGDAANLLKPALARGTLRTIAATTWAEYKKHIEKDPALTRRFQVVQVPEPTEERGLLMMRGIASTLEKHHRVQILDEALEASVKLSHRYIPARQLPDKSVSLLDTTCARVAISQSAVPPEVEDSRRRIEALETEIGIIGREKAIGVDTVARDKDARAKLGDEQARLRTLEGRWQDEKKLVDRLLELRRLLRGKGDQPAPVEGTASTLEAQAGGGVAVGSGGAGGKDDADPVRLGHLEELKRVQKDLATLQGETPLILPTVDAQAVASVVADWTGIPVGKMVRNEIEAVLKLSETLNQRVIGQKHALDMIARRVQTSRAGLENPTKPIGVFLLAGPSGVGKTETALALAEALYGGEQNAITINMSEFQEAHTVSTLKGSPPGYVGYGEGGVLTEAVRRRPYSVVLLDEVEKAHPDVHELFFQVFDKGWMEDGEGRRIDFHNTLILLTSNVGSDLIMNLTRDPDLMPTPEGIAQALRPPLLKVFPAALLGRLVTIPYYPLSDEMISSIVRLQLGRISKRVTANHKVPFSCSDDAIKLVVSRCTELESGGRMIDAILTNTMLPRISQELLTRMAEGKAVTKVAVGVEGSDFSYAFD
jgi:type VI secretion system protein VasG